MKKSYLGLLITSMISTSAFALADNGYWDHRTVCDYEQVEKLTPVTYCTYQGPLTGWINNTYLSKYYSNTEPSPGHITCTPSKPISNTSYEWNPSTSTYEWITYSGIVTLSSQSQGYITSTTTELVEGSCREERVWVPLCPTCQIP